MSKRPAPGGYTWRDSSGHTKPGYAFNPTNGQWVKVGDLPPAKGTPAHHLGDPSQRGKPGRTAPGNPKVVQNPLDPIGSLLKGKGAVTAKAGGVAIGTVNVRALQRHLQMHGYQIKVDGKMGAQTKAAVADYYKPEHMPDALAQLMKGTRVTGAKNSAAFNTKYGTHPAKAFRPPTGPGGTLDANGNPDYSGGTDSGADGGGGSVKHVSSNVPFKMTPESMAAMGASLLDPRMADKLAGLQFDAGIHDTAVEQQRQPRREAQDIADIRNWYGQAMASLGVAGKRDHDATAAGANSILEATKALSASLGGSANEGSGLVNASGAEAVGTLRALGTAEEQYNDDMGPIMKLAQAGASAGEHARQVAAAQDLESKMVDLKGQRGQAKTAALMDILTRNNATKDSRLSNALGIRASNNALAEQDFQNHLASQQAELAAASLGVKMTTAAAKLGKPAKGSFGDTGANIKSTAASQARASIVDPTTGKLTTSVPGAVARVNQALRSYGWSLANPAVLEFRNNVLKSAGITPNPAWR